jgi:hypothetical protein
MMLQVGWDDFQKNKNGWWIHRGRDGFNIRKDVPLSGTNFGFKMIKLRLGG